MSKENQPVYFKYENRAGNPRKFRVLGFVFEGDLEVSDFGYIELPPGKIRVLKCKCGSNDWNEDGRFINEYCCNGCGKYIEVYEYREKAA